MELSMHTTLELGCQTKAGKKDKGQMSKQTSQVEPSKLMDSQGMPSRRQPRTSGNQKQTKLTRYTSKDRCQRPGIKCTVKSHSTYTPHQSQTEGLAHQTLFRLATTNPNYIPLSNNTNHCIFCTSANNNCDYCQHYPNRIHTIFQTM